MIMIIPTPMGPLYWEPSDAWYFPSASSLDHSNPLRVLLFSPHKMRTQAQRRWVTGTRSHSCMGFKSSLITCTWYFLLSSLSFIILSGKQKANDAMVIATSKTWVSTVRTLCTEQKGASLPTLNENTSYHVTWQSHQLCDNHVISTKARMERTSEMAVWERCNLSL